ncbi:6467_t:CDS:2 [Cetraspora pellucida]|uniref:6467_t:CDS:1 n=1 Tax=Cetraspora pellucida TaxID=1433469 RepID=A0A9N9BZ18_9GLOM|nr:6467_t:CDS:2 [Cetraspora pellucida]
MILVFDDDYILYKATLVNTDSDICEAIPANNNLDTCEVTPVNDNSDTIIVGQTFKEWSDVEQHIYTYAIKHSFTIRLNYTDKNLGFLIRAEIVCHYARAPSNKSSGLRRTKSVAIDIAAVVFDLGHCKLSNVENMHVRMLYNGEVPVPTIINMLSLSQTVKLLCSLNNNNEYLFTYSVNNNKLHCLFFTTHSAVAKFKYYPEVLLMDSTYKTNCFVMPLLLISSVDAIGIIFLVASRLLANETTPSFYLAFVSALKTEASHVRHQLCIWHVKQNIIKNLSKKLKNKFIAFIKDFKTLMFKSVETQFNTLWDHLIACCYTNKNINYEIQTTQQSETSNAHLKCLLGHIAPLSELINALEKLNFVYSLLLKQYNLATSYNVERKELNLFQVYRNEGHKPRFNTDDDMFHSEENSIESITELSYLASHSNRSLADFLPSVNHSICDITNQQISIKSTVDLLKDIESISNRVGHVKINNILAHFVEQLNNDFSLLKEDIEDSIIVKTKKKPSNTKRKKTGTEHAIKKVYMCSICSSTGHNS